MSARRFAVFRVALATYLFVHFIGLLPWSGELFSSIGALPDPSVQPGWGLFPNALAVITTPAGVSVFVAALAGLSLLLLFDVRRRTVAILLWYGWACLFGRNGWITNPSIPYVGWLLLASALIPALPAVTRLGLGAHSAAGGRDNKPGGDGEASPRVPTIFVRVAWVLLALGYTASGLHKLSAPSWISGDALSYVLQLPLARPLGVAPLLLALPPIFLKLCTWATLALEVLYLPLAFVRRTRPWVWWAGVALQVGILFALDFADLTFGMLLIHLFVFDSAWLPARVRAWWRTGEWSTVFAGPTRPLTVDRAPP